MAKIVLNDTTGGYNISVINDNFDKIEDALNNEVFYRDNPPGEPNALATDLDANSQRIYNLPEPLLANEAARLQDVQNAVAGASQANLIGFTPTGTIASTNVQAAIAEVSSETAAANALKVSTADLANPVSPLGAALAGVTPRNGASATNVSIWIRQQKAIAENYPNLQAALNSGASIVELSEPAYSLGAGVTIPSGVTLEGRGKAATAITLTSNITPFTMANVNDAGLEGVLIIANAAQTAPLILLDASSTTIARCRVNEVQGSGSATDFPFISLLARSGPYGSWAHKFSNISVSGCGTVLRAESQAVNSWINSLQTSHVYANDFIRGAHLISTLGDGCSESTFFDWATQTSARTQFGALIADVASQGISRKNSFTDVRFYDLLGTALAYYVGSNVLDTTIQGCAVDDLVPLRVRDTGVNTKIQGMWTAEYMAPDRLTKLSTGSGLTPAVTGTGTTSAQETFAQLRTGATGASTARLFSTEAVAGLTNNSVFNADFGSPFVFSFYVSRIGAGASSVSRIQFKRTQADGALVAPGLGLVINNYDLVGESYGSTLASVNLGFTLVDSRAYQVDIVTYPGVRVEWWVNGVLRGTTSTATEIPSGSGACYLQASAANVAANDIQTLFGNVKLRANT